MNAGDRPVTQAIRASLPKEVELLRKRANEMGVTLEALFLTGFACLLSRLTRHGRLTITVNGSRLAIFHLEEGCTFWEALEQSRSTRPLNNPDKENTGSSICYEFLPEDQAGPEIVACGLQLLVKGRGSNLELASPRGLWQEDTLKAWLSSLLVLVRTASEDPSLDINGLPLWDEAEARIFYSSLNQTSVEYPGEPSVPGRFALQVRQRPEATAVISAGRRYSYRDLEKLSTELARRLVAAGAGPNRAVAVCMERSADLPLALLAVLKSGAYYVPLDPHHPIDRLRSIVEECRPVAFLIDKSVPSSLSAGLKFDFLTILYVDQPGTPGQALPKLPDQPDPADLAYTIYTSGTTGKPKGVPISHRALLNLICFMWSRLGANQTDRTLAVAPISFDIATMDMFLPLCSGGTLVIAGREDAVDPYRLVQLLKDFDITFMQATPVVWRMLVTAGWSGKPNLKMISGGEALPRELANDLLRRGRELWNCYGPTETTIYSSVLRIEPDLPVIPLGPPIANTSFYVMDKAGHLLPPGAPGELYIGGRGVSPGYLSFPELNAKRFVPNRFASGSDGSEGSLFTTGDLVRIVHGNQLEFFGRLDHQVKLRGFRIELGEIESVLRTHPLINDAVVVLREDIPDEPRLVAYVTSSAPLLSAAALREYASKSLPEYMLPSLVVTLERLPLSTSGKIDRRSLPIPESIPRQIVADQPEAALAEDELEIKLLRIFREVLKNDSIGVTDSFFLYGGYSLLTVRLFSQIDRDLHVRLPISLLFDAPTVRDLARMVRKGVSPSVIVPIRPYGRSAPLFLIQSYLLYYAILQIVEMDRPVYGVRELGDEQESMSVDDQASKFAQEILAVCPDGPLFLAGWCAAGSLTVEIAHQLRDAGRDVGLVALFDAERPGFTLPGGLIPWASRQSQRVRFHLNRFRAISWKERIFYILDAFVRNWDRVVGICHTVYSRILLWRQERLKISLPAASVDNASAGASAIKENSVRPYPGKLTLFRAADVPNFSEIDATLGWAAIAQGGVKVDFVPGDHVSMFMKPYSLSLATRLQQELQESETDNIKI